MKRKTKAILIGPLGMIGAALCVLFLLTKPLWFVATAAAALLAYAGYRIALHVLGDDNA